MSALVKAAYSTQTQLCWHLGHRLLTATLQGSRAAYGKQILVTVSQELTAEYGRGFSHPEITRMVQFAQLFPDEHIVVTLSQQLSWSHFHALFPVKDSLAREFYAEMCRVERWDVRTLRQKIGGMLFERTALSKRPKAIVATESPSHSFPNTDRFRLSWTVMRSSNETARPLQTTPPPETILRSPFMSVFLTRRKQFKTGLVVAFLLSACSGPMLLANEPMGKTLDRALKTIEEQCRESGAPPFGPNKPRQFETACLMFALKPWLPGDSSESEFAHSINLPPPHNKPKDLYKAGISSEAYFHSLCKEEAGEWIFARAEGVRGIRQERPPLLFPLGYESIVFYATERAGFGGDRPAEYFVKPFGPYDFFELRQTNKGKAKPAMYKRFRFTERSSTTLYEEDVSEPLTTLGYTWRGIRRLYDYEHGITGSELIVFRSIPFQVLAVRREFSYYYLNRATKDLRSPSVSNCPGTDGRNQAKEFIESILIPIN